MVDLFPSKVHGRKGTIKLGVDHRLKKEDVAFEINGEEITFSRFYVGISEAGLVITIKGETPMTLILMLDAVIDQVGVDRKRILQSTKVDIVLRLDHDLFAALKDRILASTEVKHVFDIEYEGFRFLKDLSNYSLEEYVMITRKLKVHVGGTLVESIKRKL